MRDVDTHVLDAVYERTPADIATAVEMLLNHEHLTIQDQDVVSAALEVARKAGHVPLGTFDRDLGKRSGAQRL